MNCSPKVSILIPAYNVNKYIRDCLNSVCNQTYTNLQIVIIDDGSDDNTLEIISEFALRDKRLEIHTRPNKGVAATRNELLDYVTGDYILFVDADDWIELDMVASLVEMIIRTKADIAMCSNIPEYPNQNSCPIINHKEHIHWNQNQFLVKFLLHRELTGSLWNKLIQANLFSGIRFPSGIAYGEDALVTWELLKKAKNMVISENQYYHYRMNNDSVSHQGLTPAKVTALSVWNHICATIPNSDSYLARLANARRGAEMTLLLLNGVSNYTISKDTLFKLRRQIRNSYSDMIISRSLSKKFLLFAALAAYVWPLAKLIGKKAKI